MRYFNDNRGMVFVMTMAICMLITTIGMTYLFLVRSEIKIRENFLNTLKRHYYADAGVEHIIAALRSSGNFASMFNRSASLDSEGTSYYAEYLPDSRTIKSRIYIGSFPFDRVEAKINESGFTTALMAGGSVSWLGSVADVRGTINGNVEAESFSLDLQNSENLSIIGTVKTYGVPIQSHIPNVIGSGDLTVAYGGILINQTGNYSVSPGLEGDMGLFVKGNIDILEPNVSITGILVATGDIRIGVVANNFTMNADQATRRPALVAGGDIYIGDSQALNVTINGLVYSQGDIYVRGAQNLVINGALVARGHIYFYGDTINPITNMKINYDPDLRPANFIGGYSGANYIKIVSWKAHKTN